MTDIEPQEIKIFRRDTTAIDVGPIKDSDGVVFDVSDFTVKLTVKKTNTESPDAQALMQVTGSVIDGPSGTVRISLSATNTNIPAGNYFYDVQINKTTVEVYTVAYVDFIVLQDKTVTMS